MPGLTEDQLQEYIKELEQLADEWNMGDETTKVIAARKKDIRERIIAVADKFDSTHRVVMPVPNLELQWDRMLAKRAGTGDVSLDRLEDLMGAKKFKAACTSRTTIYNFDMGKFLASRESGVITDTMIAACTVPPQYDPRLSLKKLVAVPEEEDEVDVEWPALS